MSQTSGRSTRLNESGPVLENLTHIVELTSTLKKRDRDDTYIIIDSDSEDDMTVPTPKKAKLGKCRPLCFIHGYYLSL